MMSMTLMKREIGYPETKMKILGLIDRLFRSHIICRDVILKSDTIDNVNGTLQRGS